jgi:adenylosuccinate lyase
MIARYSRKEMAAVWSDENRYRVWVDVEVSALEVMAEHGLVPKELSVGLRDNIKIDVIRITEIEAEVKHDVIAFLTAIAEQVGDKARGLHRGMTSSDLIDTANAILMRESFSLLTIALKDVLAVLRELITKYRHTPIIGRSHGIHAEPTTFGVKLAGFYAECRRRLQDLENAREVISFGKVAGAVGTYSLLSPEIEGDILARFHLRPEVVPTQIVQRDRYAHVFSVLALLGASIERIAVEIRHLQRSEVREVEEGFSKGQKGSSAMPHKKNPILSENLCGLSRLLRSYAQAALENVPLWHERDISHSSVERVICPDGFIVTDFMLGRLKGLLENLVVHEARMLENVQAQGFLSFSGAVLVALADGGLSREVAYEIVQKHALTTWESGGSFQNRISNDAVVKETLTPAKINEIFNLERHLRYCDFIIERSLQA